MALTIAVVSQKGGVGKTTLTLNLAAALHAGGSRVLVVDADPQGTAQVWSDIAQESGVDAPTVVATTGPSMRQVLSSMGDSFDVIVIDTPPRMNAEAKAAMLQAHVVLVPLAPGPENVWSLAQTASAIEEVQLYRPDLLVRAVLNKMDKRTALSASLRDDLGATSLQAFDNTLTARVAFPEATATGQGAVSYAPRSPAAREVAALADEILELVATGENTTPAPDEVATRLGSAA